MAGRFLDLLGTTYTKLQIGLGASALALKVASGKLRARNAADSADVAVVGSIIAASGDSIEINEDASGSGADRKYTIARPASGMAGDLSITLPADVGTNGFALVTNGAGVTSWQAVAGGNDREITDTTSIAFGSAGTVAMYTHPANAVVQAVKVVIDTPFNGVPSLSVGITGTLSKYLAASAVDLTAAAGTSFEVDPGVVANGSAESIIATYAAAGATAGAARILMTYVIPS